MPVFWGIAARGISLFWHYTGTMPSSPVASVQETPANPSGGTLCSPAAAAETTISDGELLRRYLQKREEPAFAELVARFGPLVYAVALRSLRDSHAAEDVFQATFLVLARDASKIRRPDSVAAWLHGTALRLAKKALSRRQRESPVESLMHLAVDQPLLEQFSAQFDQHVLDDELQKLAELDRAVLVLHYLEGKSCAETAAALNTSEGAVRGRLQRSKHQLRVRLMRRGVELSTVLLAVGMWQSLAKAAIRPDLVSGALQGGMAVSQGCTFGPSCSPEAVQLAAKETAMLTTGNVVMGSAVLVATATLGWFAHAGITTHQSPTEDLLLPEPSSVVSDEGAYEEQWELAQVDVKTAAGEEKNDSSEPGNPVLTIKYDDGKPDGKKSIAGTGEMIQFTLPDKSQKLRSIRIHCARYGYPKPPDEDVEISIVSGDETEVVHTEMVPYAKFQRGESRWTTIGFEEPVNVPEKFWVILQFNAERTKGVYVSYDTSTEGKHSRTGLPGAESKPVNFGGDWMIQAILTKPKE